MKCIFCFEERPPSDEHIIPESVGGKLRLNSVCRECNSGLSRLVDGPFAQCSIIQLARFTHSLGGTRVSFSADASDKDKLDQMLGNPLRKTLAAEFPLWSPEQRETEVAKVLAHAHAQVPISERGPIKSRWSVGLDDLLFEFMKIAYEMWFRRFGYPWVETSATAKILRTAIQNRDGNLPVRAHLLCPDVPLPVSDAMKNHVVLQMKGGSLIRLFNITCALECEAADEQFMLSEKDSWITIQDFLSGAVIEEKLLTFLATHTLEA
jgi:hypothetical protein